MEEDRAYFDSLLPDLVVRSRQHPLNLFKQLCSLGVGPLVTQEAGESIANHSAMLLLSSRFVQFCGPSFPLQSLSRSIIISPIREEVSKPDDATVPLPVREYHELHLYDSSSPDVPAYCIRDVLHKWDDVSKKVVLEEAPTETFLTFEEAKKWYFERRLTLAQQGFSHSEMYLS